MPSKLDAAAAVGIQGIEIFHEDLDQAAAALPGGSTPSTRLQTAHTFRSLCSSLGLSILCLQPFMHSEGLLDPSARWTKLTELAEWMSLACALGTDLIQLPASFLPATQLSSDIDIIAADMREVADLGAAHSPPLRFAMEALCFSTHVDTWEASLAVVRRVDRANFGLCLDTFNIAGRVYGDPAAVDGMVPDACAAMDATVARLARVPREKVFFIQVVDAQRLEAPLVPGHELYDEEMSPRMAWSRNCRLFYGEEERGAYLPITQIVKAIICDAGYRGWVSMEYFNRDMAEPGADVPRQLAGRAMRAWRRLEDDLGLVDGEVVSGPLEEVVREQTQSQRTVQHVGHRAEVSVL